MEEFKLIKCFSQEDCEVLKLQGHEFFSEDNGTFYLILNDKANFSNCQVKYEITNQVNF